MIKTYEKDQHLVVVLPARFDFKMADYFREIYHNHPPRSYHIDFSAVHSMDSAALGMLLLLREHCGGEQARITLKNCHGQLAQLLRIARFEQIFHTEPALS
ncbi:anti-sigma-factor antagonist [Magnetococcus marinus MC-1]|uniref:Anti-sigma-factor antagonist n=1 Tax=Magnetococcus marinus (strain ATCC BAA-1437 / JCM 17883 / MC-1) TaxID=156889 RepID=A0LBV5_MAGMM|nr:STAS domain-containing protein [Magnetococcus marinus]ABK45448.1 anti-sigma-factor antagonist [Magnetococcus marinus MC-1]